MLLLVAGYFVTGALGLEYAHVGHSVTLLWAPTGIALAALLALGRTHWPAVALGSLLVDAFAGLGVLPCLLIAAGNSLHAWVGCTLLERVGFEAGFQKRRDVAVFLAFGVLVPPTISASIGTLALGAGSIAPWTSAPQVWLIWWLGDAAGVLVIAPALLALLTRAEGKPAAAGGRRLEAIALAASVPLALSLSFQFGVTMWSSELLLVPIILWAALRFGTRGVVSLTPLIAFVAVWGTTHGQGPFVQADPRDSVLSLWAFLSVLGGTGLLLAALLAEKNTSEDERRTSERQFRDIFDAAQVGMMLVGRDGRVLQANRQLAATLGYDAERLKEQSWIALDAKGNLSRAFSELDANGSRGPSAKQRAQLLAADGRELVTDVSIVPFRGSPGRSDLAIVQVDDVTEREQQRQQREDLDAHLQHTQMLDNVGQLAGGVAHDFNNLLLVISAYADLSLSDSSSVLSSETRECMEGIQETTDRGALLTRQLLALSRRQTIQTRVVDLVEVASRVKQLIDRALPKTVEFVMLVESEYTTIQGDAAQIEQVLMNLCMNSHDAMPNGGTLTLRVGYVDHRSEHVDESDAALGDTVTVSVSDTGTGMDDETRKQVFMPFFTTKSRGQGTGLGLATAHSIIQKHQGRVEVKSSLGRGSTFHVQFPYAEPVVTRPTRPAIFDGANVTGDETLLIVDDETVARQLIARMLSRSGYKVLQAQDGVEAVELVQRQGQNIDLVLMDVVMPRMNGREAFEQIRSAYPSVRFIFTSGYTDDALPEAFLAQHGLSLLGKPFDRMQLLALVRRTLDAGRVSEQSMAGRAPN